MQSVSLSMNKRPDSRLVTLRCNGAWQPVDSAEFQYKSNTAQFTCIAARYVVDGVYPDGEVITHDGAWWEEHEAYVYARSLANGNFPRAVVRLVNPYWYVRHFGRVTPDAEERKAS